MPLFQRHKPLPLAGLLESEEEAFNAVCESLGIANIAMSQGAKAASGRLREHLEEWVSRNPVSEVWVYYILGNLYLEEGNLEEAAATYSRAAEYYPADPRALYSLGTMYYGIFQVKSGPLPDAGAERDAPWEIRERMRRVREFEEQNQQLVQSFRKSELVCCTLYIFTINSLS